MKQNTKICPRCRVAFECKVDDITNCQCNIPINDATRVFLSKTTFDCLCADCLLHLNQLVLSAQSYQFPHNKEMIVEGLHYYDDEGYWTFTEMYHLLRGFCCGCGCRHCVYGYKKN